MSNDTTTPRPYSWSQNHLLAAIGFPPETPPIDLNQVEDELVRHSLTDTLVALDGGTHYLLAMPRFLSTLHISGMTFEQLPEDIRSEVLRLYRAAALREAQDEHLTVLRRGMNCWNGENSFGPFRGNMERALERGKGNLSDIGTSEEELEQLRHQWSLRAARVCVENMQNLDFRGASVTTYANRVRKYLAEPDSTLDELKITQEDLDRVIHRATAVELLRRLHDGSRFFRAYSTRIRSSLASAGMNLEDIGSSEEELSRLSRRR